MSKPYGLMADCHLHNWSQFASVDEKGRNTRLMGLIDEMQKCVDHTKQHGGDTVYVAGDLFHVRGSIKPSVFNEAYMFFERNKDIHFVLIAGNHDLETKVSDDRSSALTALEGLKNVRAVGSELYYVDDNVIAIPWVEDITVDYIKKVVSNIADDGIDTEGLDLILHAPLDGVLPNVSGGLDPKELAELPVRNTYSGHFHNYCVFEDKSSLITMRNKVISIGSLAQFSFGECDNKTGHMVVKRDASIAPYFWYPTEQPRYLVATYDEILEVIRKLEEGLEDVKDYHPMYLKVRIDAELKPAELTKFQKELLKQKWCMGVIFQMTPKQVERTGFTATAGSSLSTSVKEYVDGMKTTVDKSELGVNCQRILHESEML